MKGLFHPPEQSLRLAPGHFQPTASVTPMPVDVVDLDRTLPYQRSVHAAPALGGARPPAARAGLPSDPRW